MNDKIAYDLICEIKKINENMRRIIKKIDEVKKYGL